MEKQVAVKSEIIVEITWDSGRALGSNGPDRLQIKFLHPSSTSVAATGNLSQTGLLSNKATAASKITLAPKYQNSKGSVSPSTSPAMKGKTLNLSSRCSLVVCRGPELKL